MPINFIPNDPLAPLPLRQQPARKRKAKRAGFTFTNKSKQKLYAPGTPNFLFWQCRESALLAVETWESLKGPLTDWSEGVADTKKLALIENAGLDLNAFYDRESVSFFEFTTGDKTTFSGASTDIVAHEVGHALLDVIRPDLWDSVLLETGAFHEAFGDCVALLAALSDQATRAALLAATADLGAANFVEALAEDLADGINRQFGTNDPALRNALNGFKWQLPSTLPPAEREVHTFGRIFVGCFYDVLRNIFASLPAHGEAELLAAAQTAGKLLIAGASQAPLVPRFFQAVGRAMVLADHNLSGGANRQAIRDAFDRHTIALGSAAMLAPRAGLAGDMPAAGAANLAAVTRDDLRRRIGAAPNARLTVNEVEIGGMRLMQAVHQREVSLTGLSEQLAGVVAIAQEPVLVGASGRRAAVMSALPEANTTTDEVHAFVESLLSNNQIAFAAPSRGARRGVTAAAAPIAPAVPGTMATHTVRAQGGKKLLARLRFVCRCGR